MKVTVNKAEKSQKELHVEIPYEKYEEAFENEYNKIKGEVKIPGFRQGKAPKENVIKEFKHRINMNAMETLINQSVYESLSQNGINALSTPSVKDVQFEENKPITFKIVVDVFPEYDIDKYKDFEFVQEIANTTEDDVNKVIEEIRTKNTTFEPAPEKAEIKTGDMASIDFVGTLDGVEFPGGSAKDTSIVVGSNTFLKDFEDGVVGMKSGETKNIPVEFPESYHEKSLAGKVANFAITVHEIKNSKLPDLDDDFAKEVSEDCETFEEFKKQIEQNLKDESLAISKEKLYDNIIDKLIEENPFELPETMVKEQALRLAEQTIQHYQYMYGVSPEMLGMKKENVAETMKDKAVVQLKGALILNKVAEKESIKVEEADIDAKIKDVAERLKKDFEEYKKELTEKKAMQNIENSIFSEKILKYLVDLNKVETKYVDKQDVQPQENIEEQESL